jgi:Tol biopolymer transport system component
VVNTRMQTRTWGTVLLLLALGALFAPTMAQVEELSSEITFVLQNEIYVIDVSSGNLRNLTNNGLVIDYLPRWSSDGNRIVFRSDRDGNHEIYIMDSCGNNVHRLTINELTDSIPNWSPDGTKIVFESGADHRDIFVVDIDGSDLDNLTNNDANDYDPRWSPDGNQIAFVSDRDGDDEIYVMDKNGQNTRQLTNNEQRDLNPAWSPDGTQIVFLSSISSNGYTDPYAIRRIDVDEGTVTQLYENGGGSSWSPTGREIFFLIVNYSDPDIDIDIGVMDADGNNITNLTSNLASDDLFYAVSPSGDRIAFVSRRDGNYQIYIMNNNGSNLHQITDFEEGTPFMLSWRPEHAETQQISCP